MTDDSFSCKYTARIERVGDRYVVDVPDREVELGPLSTGDVCQITVDVLEATTENPNAADAADDGPGQPPVSTGQRIAVEIEDVGQQGDGIARVDEGYVLIVPGSEVGDEVTVEVQQTNPTYGFAEIVGRESDESAVEADDADEPGSIEDGGDGETVSLTDD